jgi:hypothetical protein
MVYGNSQLNASNSIMVDGYQIAVQSDRTNQLAKRVSSRQFALPVVQDKEEYFWLLVRSLFGDASLYVAINGIISQSSWVLDEGKDVRFDHQPGGDKGRFCVMRRQGNEQIVQDYATAGINGSLANIGLEFHKLQPEYRPQIRYSKGIGDDVLRGSRSGYDFGATLGGATRSVSFESNRGGDFNYEEAIIATGGESSMNTRKVDREEDDSSPIIQFSLEIVAAPAASNVRIPNASPAPQTIFSW